MYVNEKIDHIKRYLFLINSDSENTQRDLSSVTAFLPLKSQNSNANDKMREKNSTHPNYDSCKRERVNFVTARHNFTSKERRNKKPIPRFKCHFKKTCAFYDFKVIFSGKTMDLFSDYVNFYITQTRMRKGSRLIK